MPTSVLLLPAAIHPCPELTRRLCGQALLDYLYSWLRFGPVHVPRHFIAFHNITVTTQHVCIRWIVRTPSALRNDMVNVCLVPGRSDTLFPFLRRHCWGTAIRTCWL